MPDAAWWLWSSDRSPRRFPPEQGRLRRPGRLLIHEDGSVFDWRGASMFLLLARLMRGESIQAQIDWMLQLGVNVARVFVAGVPWGGEWEFFRQPWRVPGWLSVLDQLFALLSTAGIRTEAVIATYPMMPDFWGSVAQETYRVAAQYPLVMVEATNEPTAASWTDPVAMLHNVNRLGVPSAYGLQPELTQTPVPVLDWLTWHSPRDRARYHRNAKDGYEIIVGSEFFAHHECPVVGDEPFGIGELDKDGGGARNTDLAAHVSHFAIHRLLTTGATMHTQAGLEGRAPDPEREPIQTAICQAISDMWAFIPPNTQLGNYARPGLGDFGLTYDSTQTDHPYASVLDNVQYVCYTPTVAFDSQYGCLRTVLKPQGWQVPPAINDWRITDIGPQSWLVRLER